MAKLVLSLNGKVVNHYFIDKPSITIGRGAGSDISIEDTALAPIHLSLIKLGHDTIAEVAEDSKDIRVNGKPLTRQILKHLDIIDLGRHQLRYMSAGIAADAELDRTMFIQTSRTPDASGTVPLMDVAIAPAGRARLMGGSVEFIAGPAPFKAGKMISLENVVTTFGEPGEQLLVLTRRPHGIFVSHVEGKRHPRVNGRPVGEAAHELKSGDLIEGAGYKLKFISGRD
jgi:hypothetical protein